MNLIGDHTDYQDGFCLPMAIDREVRVSFRARDDGVVSVDSQAAGNRAAGPATGEGWGLADSPEWARTVAAVLRVLGERGRPPVGFDARVDSTVPLGAGLSSSAAFEVAVAIAAARAAGFELVGNELARAAQASEHRASGMPCGVMDQMAAVHGRAGHALALDCRSLDYDLVALPPAVAVLVVHSGLTRRLETSEYAARRAACERAAGALGVAALRDVTYEQVAGDPVARHVVSENARVLQFVASLREGDLARCGALMRESHASLRDDSRVSTPELDLLVDLADTAGAYGARLTGAGFGGCIVALTPAARAEPVAAEIVANYRAATGLAPTALLVHASDGAGVVAE